MPIDWGLATDQADAAAYQRALDLDTLTRTQDWRDQRLAADPKVFDWKKFWGFAWPGEDWGDVLPDVGHALKDAALPPHDHDDPSFWDKYGPYVAVGAAVLLAVQVVKAR